MKPLLKRTFQWIACATIACLAVSCNDEPEESERSLGFETFVPQYNSYIKIGLVSNL